PWEETMRSILGLIAAGGLLAAVAGMRADDKPSVGDKPAAAGRRGEHEQQLRRLKQLRDLHDKLDEVLRGKRQALTQLARQLGSSNERLIALQQELAVNRLDTAQQELMKTELSRIKLEAELSALRGEEKALAEQPAPQASVEESMSKDPAAQNLVERIDEMEHLLAEIARAAAGGKNDRLYRQRSRELDETKAALAARREKLRRTIRSEPQLQRQDALQDRTAELREQLRVRKEQENALSRFLDRLRKETTTMAEASLDLEALKSEVAQVEEQSNKVDDEIRGLAAGPGGQSRNDARYMNMKLEKKLDRVLKEVQELRQELNGQ
ncbi:MAG TPA: hypothetical protein VG013_29790, partial [Gemmataceae bacterium]|nr:hypothetical protein [Gemmataceae bacterium]